MPQTFVITGRVEFSGDANLLVGGRVEAYDRDLPSLEQRGKAPQLLGQSSIEGENLQFRIEFTDEQFRQTGNNSSGLRQPPKINPNLSFNVFDATGREQAVTGIVPQGGSSPVQIIFNAPPNLEGITIQAAPIPEVTISKYERLIALITPVIASIPLADLTDADVTFLVNQHGEQFDGEPLQTQIEWLRRSALLAQQTNLPIETLYAWGRKISITDSPDDLPLVLRGLLTRENTELSQTLQDAIAESIIPTQLGDRIPQILAQIERVRVNQGLLVAHQFVGKLLNERTGEPLVGFRVQGFDLEAADQPRNLGQAFSNDQGVFSLTYITPPPAEATAEQRQRRLRLEVYINSQNQERFTIEVQAGADQDVQDVQVTLPAPQETLIEQLPGLSRIEPSPSLPTVARFAAVPEPATSSDLISFLQSQNITTLEALRNAGGIRQLENLPSDVDEAQIELVETHIELYPLTNNVETSAALIERGYSSLTQIAITTQSDFVNDLRDRAGDINAAELHAVARAQTAFLNNQLFREQADRANRLETRSLGSENIRCTCQTCESAVSPLAYLTDLLKFAIENITQPNPVDLTGADIPITATKLAEILYQPFDQLRASCEAVDTPVRQVRLCIEVLRGYLKAKPPADPTKLATAEKQYLLAAYTSLLTKLGTSFSEIRLARNSEPGLRQSLADRLGIDISHVNALFLDPNAPENPEATAPKPLTEASLEELLGLVDTTRNPLAEGVKSGDAELNQITSWNLNNVQPGVNADQEGKVYVKLSKVPNLEGHDGVVRSVAFSRDGQLVVSGSVDQTMRLWDAQTRQQIGDPLQGHNSPVYSVAFSPDGSRIVSGGGDNKLRVWDTQSRQQIGELSGHDSAVLSVAFSPDGQRIVSGGGDKKLRLWDAQSLQLIAVSQEEHDDSVAAVAFSLDGQRIVSGSADQKLRLWNAQSLQPLGVPLEGHNTVVWSVAFSPDGQQIVSGGFKTLRLWDIQTGQTFRELEGHEAAVLSVAFSPDGSRIVSGGYDKTLRLWNAQTGQAIGRPLEGHEAPVWSVMFSPDGQRIVSGSEDKMVRLWNAQTRRPSTGVVRAELYQDKPLQDGSFEAKNLVASGDISTDSGTVKLLPENKSGLYGVLDIAYVADSTSISIAAVPEFLNWRLQHLRTLWKAQDWTTDAYKEELPIIDPDLVGPDDFRNLTPSDPVFKLWQKRSEWVISRLEALAALPKTQNGAPSITELFTDMSKTVYYSINDSLLSIIAWSTTTFADLAALRNQLNEGDVAKVKLRLQDEFNLTVESFTRLMAIAEKANIWESNPQSEEEVSEEEWQEVYSILVQVLKMKLFATWRQEEKDAQIQLGPESFWLSLTQPQEGDWPQTLSTTEPMIDPSMLKLKELPDAVVGEQAIKLWNDRQKALAQIPSDLEKKLKDSNGFDSTSVFDLVIKEALGDASLDLERIQNELNNLTTVDEAITEINSLITSLSLTDALNVESFKRLLNIRTKVGTSNKPTRVEWAEIYTILAKPYKIKVLYPTWKEQETPGGTRLSYWQLLKAKLPRWRASNEGRQAWLQALLDRSQPPLIDPDLIDPGDLKNSFEGSAFAIWKRRETAITEKLESLNTRPKDLAGLEQRFQDTLGISKDEFLKVAGTQARGEIIADRLVQLSLEFAEFNYLLRIVRLLEQNQPVLDSEWENINSILVQVWKRRQAAQWRSEEREEGVFRSPDFFQIQFQNTPANPLGEADTKEIWRSPRLVYLDWQEQLQTRIDQEQQTIQAYRTVIGAAEEETLEQLRDALVLAIDVQGGLEAKAKWATENLLIDAKTSSSITTTRVAQAIETLQTLFLALRTGRSEEQFKDLTPKLENYDKAWKILGSYTSWRAAMFVFLYPENLLQPSLRKWQTPAFETLVSSTFLNGDFTINDIKRIIEEYSNYIARITFLQVDATCLIGNRFYMFGASTELGGIFWSYSDAKQILENSQPIWYQIKVDSEDQKLLDSGQIFGAYCGFEHIYLFLSIQDFSGNLAISTLTSINFLKYNHKIQKWANKLISLGLPINTKSVCFIDGISIYSSPRVLILQERDYSVFELLCGSVQNDGWLSSSFESFGLITPDALIYYPFISLKAAFEIENGRIVVICDVVVTIDNEDRSEVFYILCNNNSILSITPSGRYGKYAGSFTLTQADREPIYFLVKSEESDVPELVKLEVTTDDNINEQSISIVGSIYTQLQDFFYTVPRFGRDKGLDPGSSFLNRIVISKSDNNLNNPILSCCPYINTNNELVLLSNPGIEIGSQIEAYKPFLVKPISLSDILFDLNLLTIVGLTSQGLQSRRIAIKKVIENNLLWDVYDRLDYLKEILFFIPIYFANSLSNSGEYLAALDLYRTVYDYAADQSGDTHIIYYGFVLEKNLPLTYRKAQDWLLDPLNSHAIAETRQNGYLRFTFFAVIRCLLEFADSEFTQDTSESTGRARSLYLTAQELLESKELKQSIAGCDEVIGFLDDVEPDDPRWRSAFFAIREGVNSLPDLQTRRRVVPEIQAALQTTEPIEQRFGNARAILDRATAESTPAPTLTQVIEQTENTNRQMQRTLMLDAAIQPALETLRLTARAAIDPTFQIPPDFIPLLVSAFCIPVNPILQSLRLRTETSLKKLRTGLNIAGLKRQLEPYSSPTDTTSGLPTIGAGGQLVSPSATLNLQPTLYRYQALIERAKQLVQLAAQIEAGYLSAEAGFLGAKAGGLGALAGVQSDEEKREDKRFEKGYSILKAQQDLGLAEAGIKLQDLRLTEANADVDLASYQKYKSLRQRDIYQSLISSEENLFELRLIDNYEKLYESNFFTAYESQILEKYREEYPTNYAFTAIRNKYYSGISANEAEFNIAVNSFYASFERRKQEWDLQRQFAELDITISDNQIKVTKARVGIVTQEGAIARLQSTNAQDVVKYLEGRITENPELTNTLKLTVEQFQLTAELYDYIRNVLQGIYRYFLQQATAIAKLAENQLAFERQEVPPTYIQSDYWSVPINDTTTSNPNTATPDRRGLTGSARLLQDVYQLDQYAFTTNKRKLQLTKTFSLASLAPVEFQRFRETGVILFSTPMELFDRDFPGHYLRLIRRVRTSVIALIPPTQGIKATLSTVGITRVVVGPDVFQTIPIRRDPEFVALTSPTNATGLFELESLQPDFLLPFEGNGVDSSWEFRMPKAANQFDYRTIADVLITIEYTALNSNDYRQQVIQTLNPNLSSDRPFSFRNQFADQWYDLNNSEQTKTPMKVQFQTFREDFPPNVESLKIQQILLYFVRVSEKTVEIPTTELRFTERVNQGTVGGSAAPIDGVISTRRGNAGSWTAMIGKSPVGEWELTLPNTEEVKQRFLDEEIEDILFVITYSGRTLECPT